jgi:hypothetical protein
MNYIIATSIETKLWYEIIEKYKLRDWIVTTEYEQFDKGIDFDLYELKKGNEKILFAWDNWFEGEIKCSEERMKMIEGEFNAKFKFGKPEHLSINLLDKMKSLLTHK